MSKGGKRGKSAQGAGGPPKWEQGLLSAVFEEVKCIILLIKSLKLFKQIKVNKTTNTLH